MFTSIWCTKHIFSLSSCSFPLYLLLQAGPYISSYLQFSVIMNSRQCFRDLQGESASKYRVSILWTKSLRHQNSQGTKAEEGNQINSSRTWDCELPGEQRTRWKTFFDVWETMECVQNSCFYICHGLQVTKDI